MDMPQKSGTRCVQWAWQVRPHSVVEKVSAVNNKGANQVD